MGFPTRLKSAVAMRRMTLKELAERAGVHPVTAWNWSRGAKPPRRKNLARIASVLGMTPEMLAGIPPKGRMQ